MLIKLKIPQDQKTPQKICRNPQRCSHSMALHSYQRPSFSANLSALKMGYIMIYLPRCGSASGSLEKCEAGRCFCFRLCQVIDALCATLAVDPEKLEAKLWSRWDFEGWDDSVLQVF